MENITLQPNSMRGHSLLRNGELVGFTQYNAGHGKYIAVRWLETDEAEIIRRDCPNELTALAHVFTELAAKGTRKWVSVKATGNCQR